MRSFAHVSQPAYGCSAKGATAAFSVIGPAIGPVFFGAAYDRLRGYQEILLFMCALPVLGAFISFLIRTPSRPGPSETRSSSARWLVARFSSRTSAFRPRCSDGLAHASRPSTENRD